MVYIACALVLVSMLIHFVFVSLHRDFFASFSNHGFVFVPLLIDFMFVCLPIDSVFLSLPQVSYFCLYS
jgi:hypothetical protein